MVLKALVGRSLVWVSFVGRAEILWSFHRKVDSYLCGFLSFRCEPYSPNGSVIALASVSEASARAKGSGPGSNF